MDLFLLFLAIVLIFALVIYIIYYISTFSERRKNEELLNRQIQLYQEKHKAEQAKQASIIAGETARNNIDKIAKPKHKK